MPPRRDVAAVGPVGDPVEEETVAAPEVQTPDVWAKRKGMADRFLAGGGEFAIANPEYLKFAQARAFKAWPFDVLVTEAEFDAAVIAASQPIFR